MTRTYWTVALVAAPLLAGCPPPYQGPSDTDTDTGSSTGSDTTTTTTNPTTGETTTDDTTTTPSTTTTTGPETSSTGDVTTGEPGCADDAQCKAESPDTPFCVDKECVSCEGTAEPDTACAGADPTTPVCAQDTGKCVVCTPENATLCMGNTPVCDAAANECVGCVDHDQCPASACNQETGACFAPDYVVYVDVAAQCDIGDGTMGAPFCQIAQALQKVADNDPSLGWTIKIKSGNYVQPSLIVPDGANIAIVGDGGVAKIKSTAAATLQVNNQSKVFLGKLNLSSNAEETGLACVASTIWGRDLNFALNRQGYVGTDCTAVFDRTVFFKNTSGGLSAYGVGSTKVVNSFVSNNGSNAESTYGGLLTAQGHELSVIYSTVLNNLSETGARSLECLADAGQTTIRNSVVIAFVAPSINCGTLTIEQSAVDEGKMDGDTNIAATMADVPNWFEPQVSGVYKAKADTMLKDLAVWLDGDPMTDFNGDARPNMPGGTDYAGADRPAQ